SEDDDEDGLISEEISYGEFSIDNVRQMIKEEVDKMRATGRNGYVCAD
ncbi:hypothetical protein OBE_13365, partial [human gut metagenome]